MTEPAATRHLSTEALLHALLKLLEGKQPEQTRALLLGIAQQLRGTAANASSLEPSLQGWAARFEQAAESGETASLSPHAAPATHFGLRAYQAAAQVVPDSSVVDQVISQILTAEQPEGQVTVGAARAELPGTQIGGALPAANQQLLAPELAGSQINASGALHAPDPQLIAQALAGTQIEAGDALAQELSSPQASTMAARAEGLPLPVADGGSAELTHASELAAFLAWRSLPRSGRSAERMRRRRARLARKRWRKRRG